MADSAIIDHAASMRSARKGLSPMTTAELKELIDGYKIYLETKVKKETPEESKEILIRTGVIDENGNIILRHQEEW